MVEGRLIPLLVLTSTLTQQIESESLDPPSEGIVQMGPVVFSICKALLTANRASSGTIGNTPILCQEAVDLKVLRPERSYDATISPRLVLTDFAAGVFHLTGLWGNSHREA